MTALYRLESVRAVRGDRVVLDIPELVVPEGTLFSVVGPNGAGKSTLLQILSFLSTPSSGTVHFGGARVDASRRSQAALRRQAALLHQSPYLFDETVAANVGFGLGVRGLRGRQREDRIARALEAVGLPGFGSRRARTLSGGEAQRVAVARVLAVKPRVLLLDEPFAGVDRETSEDLRRLIGTLPSEGTTVVLACHEGVFPGDPVVRLEQGSLYSTHPVGVPSIGSDARRSESCRDSWRPGS